MVEIIPNWHPVFVHFTVALSVTSLALFAIGYLIAGKRIAEELFTVASWCLWGGGIATVATVLAGLAAHYTVALEESALPTLASHGNFALATFIVILFMTQWSWDNYKSNRYPGLMFCIGMVLTCVLILTTAWYGGELVYRHGVGLVAANQTPSVPFLGASDPATGVESAPLSPSDNSERN